MSGVSTCSNSFVSLVLHMTKAKTKNDESSPFVTSVIPSEILVPNQFPLLGFDSLSSKNNTQLFPFSKDVAVPIFAFEVKEKARKEFTQSIRKIQPMRKEIIHQIMNPPEHLHTLDQRYNFLMTKAIELCKRNTALALDLKFPKPESKVVRRRHTSFFQKALQDTHQKLFQRQNFNKFEKVENIEISAPFCDTGESQLIFHQMENPDGVVVANERKVPKNKENESKEFESKLDKIFADITPIPELSEKSEEHWQLLASKSLEVKQKTRPPRYWKRNIYPPKTKKQIIQELRQKLPPRGLEYFDTEVDILSGIWIPELMIPEFKVTGLNYDSRLHQTDTHEIDWETLQTMKEKCNDWLEKQAQFL